MSLPLLMAFDQRGFVVSTSGLANIPAMLLSVCVGPAKKGDQSVRARSRCRGLIRRKT